ncbi:hypothetical protein [Spiroplasma endosymbiont of Melieria omissa]|uniref:hypothetical protein n=1 Tax=Spiroplasma endosymbiont of Melieria omissa TaxID=3139324 RepID=UPI003CCA87EE
MKQLLMTLSTLTTLTLTSSSIINTIDVANTTVNKLLTNKLSISDSVTSLFNNQYGYLSSSDWITNQIDNNYYSYDTSHANYLLSDGKTLARTLFTVDNKGELVYKKDAVIPPKDKVEVDATKQEMITHKKITTVKDKYNPYSKSEYSHTYFSGDNTDWQYIQFGGVEKHIDISQQAGADKVEHSNSLSEALGLYYIAKAVIENKISQSVAINLGIYFISQSSLKGKINNELITKIIDLIINNKYVYNFMLNMPFSNDDTSYAISYIFDHNNNIIELNYNHYSYEKSNTSNFETHVSPGPFASVDYTGDIYINYQDLYYLINNQNNWDVIYKYFTNGNLFDYSNMEHEIGDNWTFKNFWNSIFKDNLTKFLNNMGVNGIIIHIDCYGTDIWHPSLVDKFYIKSISKWN